MYDHRALGTKLLSTEAPNALVPIDDRKLVLHSDGLGRANFETFLTSDAIVGSDLRAGTEGFCGHKIHDLGENAGLSASKKFNVLQLLDIFKILL